MKEHFTDLRDSLGFIPKVTESLVNSFNLICASLCVSIVHKWKEHGMTVNGTQFDTCQKISKQCGKPGFKYCKEATKNYSQSVGRRF